MSAAPPATARRAWSGRRPRADSGRSKPLWEGASDLATTYGEQLKLFALSVDLIGQDRFKRVMRLVERYCRETLEVETVKLMLAVRDDRGQYILHRYSLGSLEVESLISLKDAQGRASAQTALAFEKNRPLWVVSAEGKRNLAGCEAYRDLWSAPNRKAALPSFRVIGGGDSSVKTSIIVPLPAANSRDLPLGVLNFETHDYLESTDEAKSELQRIAETVSILVRLLHTSEGHKDRTEQALEDLEATLSHPQPKLTKPKIFLASSTRAETDVIEVITDVLGAFEDSLDPIFWKTMEGAGNIRDQLFEAIGDCRYGICYLSEKTEDGDYHDNPNVLFEAGMFHGRQDGITLVPASWLPIRETSSPSVPFDFAQERMILVQRSLAGKLKAKVLAATLRRRLAAMLG